MKKLLIYRITDKKAALNYQKYFLNSFSKNYDIVILGGNIQDFEEFNVKEKLPELSSYDEVIISNNLNYGPIFPMPEPLSDCDFYGFSDFLIFKKNVVSSKKFQEFFKKNNSNPIEFFKKYGFKFKPLLEKTEPDCLSDVDFIEKKPPILNKKFFTKRSEITDFKINDGAKNVLNYLAENNLYDKNLILEDLIKVLSPSVLNNNLELNCILDENPIENFQTSSKAVCVFYIFSIDMVEYCAKYAQNLPKFIDILVICTNEEAKNAIQKAFSGLENNFETRIQQNRGRENSALFITARDIFEKYDYFCLVHSKKTPYFKNEIIGKNFCNHCFDNLLKSKGYIQNIIKTFDENEKLGLLIPPLNLSNLHFSLYFDPWRKNFKNAKKFLYENYKIRLEEDSYPLFPVGGMFWARTDVYKTFLSKKFKFEDFEQEPITKSDGLLGHTIERIHPYLAKNEGFYTGFAAPNSFASIYLGNLYQYLKEETNSKNTGNKFFSFKIKKVRGIKRLVVTLFGISITISKPNIKATGNFK